LTEEVKALQARVAEVQTAHDAAVHQRDVALGTVQAKSQKLDEVEAQLSTPRSSWPRRLIERFRRG
jgi:hypothetical protein